MSLSIDDIFFIMSGVGLTLVMLYKLYNVFHKAEKSNFGVALITLIISIILKYIALIGLLSNPTNILYLSINNFLNGIYLIIWILFIIEIILGITNAVKNKGYKPSKPDYMTK